MAVDPAGVRMKTINLTLGDPAVSLKRRGVSRSHSIPLFLEENSRRRAKHQEGHKLLRTFVELVMKAEFP
jgi:hypothetical protein